MVGRFLLYLAVFTASYAVKAELYVFPAPSPEATSHTLNTEITLYEEQTLSAIEQKNIDLLIKDTYQTLDKSNATSALSEINHVSKVHFRRGCTVPLSGARIGLIGLKVT